MTDFPFVVVEGIGRWAGIVANVLLAFDPISVVTVEGRYWYCIVFSFSNFRVCIIEHRESVPHGFGLPIILLESEIPLQETL